LTGNGLSGCEKHCQMVWSQNDERGFYRIFKHAVPVIGGVIGCGLIYMAFGPCCEKLKLSLQNTMLSNPDYDRENDQKTVVVVQSKRKKRTDIERKKRTYRKNDRNENTKEEQT